MNKYIYLFVVQGWYDSQYGWEDLCASENLREAAAWLRDYRSNEPNRHRLIQRRELNEEQPCSQ